MTKQDSGNFADEQNLLLTHNISVMPCSFTIDSGSILKSILCKDE